MFLLGLLGAASRDDDSRVTPPAGGALTVTTMLRLMHAAMSLAVVVRSTEQLNSEITVPATVFEHTLKLYQVTREAMQHGQGQEFAEAKDFKVIADLVDAVPTVSSVNDLLSSLDLAPFSSNLQCKARPPTHSLVLHGDAGSAVLCNVKEALQHDRRVCSPCSARLFVCVRACVECIECGVYLCLGDQICAALC